MYDRLRDELPGPNRRSRSCHFMFTMSPLNSMFTDRSQLLTTTDEFISRHKGKPESSFSWPRRSVEAKTGVLSTLYYMCTG